MTKGETMTTTEGTTRPNSAAASPRTRRACATGHFDSSHVRTRTARLQLCIRDMEHPRTLKRPWAASISPLQVVPTLIHHSPKLRISAADLPSRHQYDISVFIRSPPPSAVTSHVMLLKESEASGTESSPAPRIVLHKDRCSRPT